MKDERVYKLMTLVLLCRDHVKDDTFVGFEVKRDSETVYIFNEKENWHYSTDCLDTHEEGNWHRIHDEDLVQAEDHLIRLLKVKEGK